MADRKFYLTTVAPSTSITHALVAKLNQPDEQYLVIVKNTIVNVYQLTTTGLDLVYTKQFPYSVSFITKYQSKGRNSKDYLIFVTNNQQLVIAQLNDNKELSLVYSNNIEDRLGRTAFYGISGVVISNSHLLLHLYNHLIKIIPLPREEENLPEAPFNLRIDEQRVVGLYCLQLDQKQVIGIHHEIKNDIKVITFYEFNIESKTLNLYNKQIEDTSNIDLFIPYLGNEGYFKINSQTVSFVPNSNQISSVSMRPIHLETYCFLDEKRLLLSDNKGKMHLITLKENNKHEIELYYYPLEYQALTIPSTILYLDNSVLFWGSKGGDSHLIKINEKRCEILETFENRGPILDMTAIHDEITNKDDLLMCCNTYQQGTLKLISSGVGIDIICQNEMKGITHLYQVEMGNKEYLIISYSDNSKVFESQQENNQLQFNEIEIKGFNRKEETICSGIIEIGEMKEICFVQVTREEVNIFDSEQLKLIQQIRVNKFISHSCIYDEKLYISQSNEINVLNEKKEIKHIYSGENDISAFTIGKEGTEDVIGICYWDSNKMEIIKLENGNKNHIREINGNIYGKSIEIINNKEGMYIVIGMGDGRVLVYQMEELMEIEGEITKNYKVLDIGLSGIELKTLEINGMKYIMCLCDRPTLVSIYKGKIKTLSVNCSEIVSIVPFKMKECMNSLIVATKENIIIGNIEEIQSIHTKSLSIGVFISRIVISKQENKALLLSSEIKELKEKRIESHSIKLIDFRKMEIEDSHELKENEHALSIEEIVVDEKEMFVIGTAFAKPNEVEPSSGRILIVQIKDGKLEIVFEKDVNGAVYSIKTLLKKYLAMSIEKKLVIFEYQRIITNGEFEVKLQEKGSCNVKLIGLYVKTMGNKILVGDLMKSISVYSFDNNGNNKNCLNEVSRDFYASYTTAIEFVDENCYLSSDSNSNLLVFNTNSTGNESERFRLNNCAHIHVGECINVMCKGSIAPTHSTYETIQKKCILFGGVTGYIGGICEIPNEIYDILIKVQNQILLQMKGIVECTTPDEWKKVIDDWKRMPSSNIIDGNIVESYLEMSKEKQCEIAHLSGVNEEQINDIIENMISLFH
ncbi:DNA damage-binding protein, putative [Entamoeba dispar SAW760]|uniref:DNA damage-binding protein, putative n=1 Tax=Entamoeba dispar (strain ATCC PRA-260 / SAW760) TaxID=370354 RepID=B0EMP6_ENTDS|nr:DNA damage-binding protein, putative [Entamoeba dispar SAW760]EDR24200.1 DNA damage-binding protein, putative [Entamoeba dispar SAW760]|eukprot:EDR24200.1 DNA damage-binding protein, putative [Entamoeba dispar SAW760]